MSPNISSEMILAALSTGPRSRIAQQDLVTLNMVRDLEIKSGTVSFSIVLTTSELPH